MIKKVTGKGNGHERITIKKNKKRGQSYTFTIYKDDNPFLIAKFFDYIEDEKTKKDFGKEFMNNCNSLEELLEKVELREDLQKNIEGIFETIEIQRRSFKRYIEVGRNKNLKSFPAIIYFEYELKINNSFYGLLIEKFIPGVTLEDIDLNSYGSKEIVEFLYQMGYLIKELHENGIVHRDLSPDNIMILDGIYILIDPGVVKIQDDFPTVKSNYIFGKRSYASPEQYMGYAKSVDFSSDLYSVGIIALEMGLRYNPLHQIIIEERAIHKTPHKYLLDNLDRKIEDKFIENLGETNVTYQLFDILKKTLQVDRKFRFDSPNAFIRYINIVHERIKYD